jgi:hypothetical protein
MLLLINLLLIHLLLILVLHFLISYYSLYPFIDSLILYLFLLVQLMAYSFSINYFIISTIYLIISVFMIKSDYYQIHFFYAIATYYQYSFIAITNYNDFIL